MVLRDTVLLKRQIDVLDSILVEQWLGMRQRLGERLGKIGTIFVHIKDDKIAGFLLLVTLGRLFGTLLGFPSLLLLEGRSKA